VLAVLFLLAGSAWAAAIRPRLHTAVDNTISTRLSTRDGKIVSGDTQVLGPLGLVESGDEFQSVLQDTFAHITPQDHVETLSTDTGVLSLSIHG
jgi:hypothetical protein